MHRPEDRRGEHTKRQDLEPGCACALVLCVSYAYANSLLQYHSWDPQKAIEDFQKRIKNHEGE